MKHNNLVNHDNPIVLRYIILNTVKYNSFNLYNQVYVMLKPLKYFSKQKLNNSLD